MAGKKLAMPFLNWLSKSSFYCPSMRKPTKKGFVIDFQYFRPFGKTSRFAVVCEHHIGALIAGLRLFARPSDIARFVVAVIVNAVKAMALLAIMRKLRGVVNKCLRVCPPFVANRYASVPVIFVSGIERIVTSMNHFVPRRIKGVHSVTVICGHCNQMLQLTATTGHCGSAQASVSDFGEISTIAPTKPHDTAVTGFFDRPKRDQSAKSLARDVFGMRANGYEFVLSFIKRELGLYKLWSMITHVEKLLSAFGLIRQRVDARWPVLLLPFTGVIIPLLSGLSND